jgi:hypothetical protein
VVFMTAPSSVVDIMTRSIRVVKTVCRFLSLRNEMRLALRLGLAKLRCYLTRCGYGPTQGFPSVQRIRKARQVSS